MPDDVQFQSPTTGAVQTVPPEHWDEALKAGYKPTTHTVMYSPTGARGMVPNGELHDYVKQGYQTTPETQFEKDRSGRTGVVGALKGLIPPDPTQGRSPFDPRFYYNPDTAGFNPTGPGTAYSDLTRKLPEDLPTQALGVGKTAGNAIYRGASLFAPAAGVNPEAMEEASGRGDTANVATQAAAPLAMMAAGEALRAAPVREAISRNIPTKSDVGLALRTESGAVKPGIKMAARMGGAALGHYTGIPGAGELGGFLLGPSVADALIPDRPFNTPTKGPAAYLPTAEEFYANKGADLMRRPELPAPPPELGTPDNPGWYSKLPTRMPKPAALPAPTPELGSPENPGWVVKLPNRMPIKKALSPNPLAESGSTSIVPSDFDPQGQDLISRTRRLTVPGEEPTPADLKRAGDLTQAPLERLKTLAKFGDKLAQNELNRRLKN